MIVYETFLDGRLIYRSVSRYATRGMARPASPTTTRDLLALADRYSLDSEQIATFLRLAGEHHPGTFRVADA